MSQPEPTQLRDHLAEALRAAAFLCDDCCTEEDEAACDAAHPIQAAVLHFDQVADITGPVDAIADVMLGIVQHDLDSLEQQAANARAVARDANQRAETAQAERDRAMASVPLVCSDDRHQAKVRGLEAELAALREERDEDTRVMQALRRQRDEAEQQLDFLRAAVDLIRRADVSSDEILFGLDGQQIRIAVNVSDVFAWGCADAEDITPERLPILEQAWLDCRAVDADEWTAELYAARVRGMRPQGAAYPKEAAVAALFDACGPEREVGLGNPRRPPATAGSSPAAEPDACRVVDVDGTPVAVHGSGDMTAKDQEMFAEVVRAAKRLYAAEHAEPVERPRAQCHRFREHPGHLWLRNRESVHCPGFPLTPAPRES
ncbi:hypothetical protein [Streptacidiphilus cavernicola]|uniref:Uncharacterized protein n=1 Tax=Streptacidiphilus cavernicola TaxID=3342716 RepID=A0ABV6W454_9ACTN